MRLAYLSMGGICASRRIKQHVQRSLLLINTLSGLTLSLPTLRRVYTAHERTHQSGINPDAECWVPDSSPPPPDPPGPQSPNDSGMKPPAQGEDMEGVIQGNAPLCQPPNPLPPGLLPTLSSHHAISDIIPLWAHLIRLLVVSTAAQACGEYSNIWLCANWQFDIFPPTIYSICSLAA